MLRSGIGNVEHQTTFGVPESPPPTIAPSCENRLLYSVRCQLASCNRLRGGLQGSPPSTIRALLRRRWMPERRQTAGRRRVDRPRRQHQLAHLDLPQSCGKSGRLTRGCARPSLGNGPAVPNFFVARVLAYQARSRTGSVDKSTSTTRRARETFSGSAELLNESY
jgi:hypothetical protein